MTAKANLAIMEKMERFTLMFIAIMFLANTFAVSAWAKPCINMDINMASSTQQVMDMSNIPCHEDKEEKSPTKHCDGVCLCLHASIHQTPILNDNSAINAPIINAARLFNKTDNPASMATAPPRRPPKTNS